jgi:hypothetical protein
MRGRGGGRERRERERGRGGEGQSRAAEMGTKKEGKKGTSSATLRGVANYKKKKLCEKES